VGFLCHKISVTLDELKYAIKTLGLWMNPFVHFCPVKNWLFLNKVARLVITTARVVCSSV